MSLSNSHFYRPCQDKLLILRQFVPNRCVYRDVWLKASEYSEKLASVGRRLIARMSHLQA